MKNTETTSMTELLGTARQATQSKVDQRELMRAAALSAERERLLRRREEVLDLLEAARDVLSKMLVDGTAREFLCNEPWTKNKFRGLEGDWIILALWQSAENRPFILGLARNATGALELNFWECKSTSGETVRLIQMHDDALAYTPKGAEMVLKEMLEFYGFLTVVLKAAYLPLPWV